MKQLMKQLIFLGIIFLSFLPLGRAEITINDNDNIGYFIDSDVIITVYPYTAMQNPGNGVFTQYFDINKLSESDYICLAYVFNEPIEYGKIYYKKTTEGNYTNEASCNPPFTYNYSDNILNCYNGTELLYSQHYDSYDLLNYKIYWNEPYTKIEWIDKTNIINNIERNGKYIYYTGSPLSFPGFTYKIQYKPKSVDDSYKWDLRIWGTSTDNCLCVLNNSCDFLSDFDPAWFNYSWDYRKNITITNNSAPTVSNYYFPYEIKIDTGALITAGKMQADGDDLRLIDPDGETVPFVNETPINQAGNTTFLFSANVGTYSLYYGNANAEKLVFTGISYNNGTGFESDCQFSYDVGNATYWLCLGAGSANRPGLRKGIISTDATNGIDPDYALFGLAKYANIAFYDNVFKYRVLINESGIQRIQLYSTESGIYVEANYTFFFLSPFVEFSLDFNGTPTSADAINNFITGTPYDNFETDDQPFQDIPAFVSNAVNGGYHNHYGYIYDLAAGHTRILANPKHGNGSFTYTFYVDSTQGNAFEGLTKNHYEILAGFIGINFSQPLDIARTLNWSFDYYYEDEEGVPPIPTTPTGTLNLTYYCDVCDDIPIKKQYCYDDNNFVTEYEEFECIMGFDCIHRYGNNTQWCNYGCSNGTLSGLGNPGCIENDFMVAILFFVIIIIIFLIVRFAT